MLIILYMFFYVIPKTILRELLFAYENYFLHFIDKQGSLAEVIQLLAAEIKINSVLPLNSLFLPDVRLYKGANKDFN